MRFLNSLMTVHSLDPDDERRRKLLSILVTGIIVLSALAMVFALYLDFFTDEIAENIRPLYRMAATTLVSGIFILLINRFWSGYVASILFLLLVSATLIVNTDPQYLISDFLFYLIIPILMASVILKPWSSFIVAGLIGLVVVLIGLNLGLGANIPAVLGAFMIALVSWLSARSLESALQDLRVLNAELDLRVQERTRELAEANDELADANEKLKELDRLKSRFVSMVSHELRTPLSAIQGFAEMLEAGIYGDINEKQQGAIDRIKANDQRLLNLVNDLLDQARMEAGQLSLHMELFQIDDLVQDMESTMRVLAESKGLRLTVIVDEDVPQTLMGDAKRLHQILVNLINNSLKFTKEGGIDVHFYCPDSEHWAMDVTDTGPGIPSDAVQYIFDPFRQVDGSTTREHKGFGLGLAIVKQLSELMGGGVTVASELDQGCTFTVNLPIKVSSEDTHD